MLFSVRRNLTELMLEKTLQSFSLIETHILLGILMFCLRMNLAATQFEVLSIILNDKKQISYIKIQLFFFLHLYKIFIIYAEKGCPHSG
jgi:hypothetical protein